MAAQIVIQAVGVPSERDTGVPRDVVTSADAPATVVTKLDAMATSAMTSNNMPAGRRI